MTSQIIVIKLESAMDTASPFFEDPGEFKTILHDFRAAAEFTHGFWGIEDEDKTMLRVFLNWNSESKTGDHDSIMEKLKNLNSIQSVHVYHVDFLPPLPTKPLDPEIAGNTMVETIYFDKNFPHADGWVSNFNKKVDNIMSLRGDQFKAASGGWTRQMAVAPGTEDECLVWFALVGWPSMQAHLEWRESPEHHENTKLLEQYKDWWKGIVRVHSTMHEI